MRRAVDDLVESELVRVDLVVAAADVCRVDFVVELSRVDVSVDGGADDGVVDLAGDDVVGLVDDLVVLAQAPLTQSTP